MSSALAIASVTAVLKSLLDNGLVQHGIAASVGDVTVTALPPDRVTTGADERSQLNLFLYRVTPNTGWRRARLALEHGGAAAGNGKSAAGNGKSAAGQRSPGSAPAGTDQVEEAAVVPPLALDLHYLLTAYGEQDFHAEILLGCAMKLLHQTPALTRAHVNAALESQGGSGAPVPPVRAALAASRLGEQVEEIRITAESANTEELSRLWSALQARYRPSAAYRVSAVLLETGDRVAGDGAAGEAAAGGAAVSATAPAETAASTRAAPGASPGRRAARR
jgi:hypothetical protein